MTLLMMQKSQRWTWMWVHVTSFLFDAQDSLFHVRTESSLKLIMLSGSLFQCTAFMICKASGSRDALRSLRTVISSRTLQSCEPTWRFDQTIINLEIHVRRLSQLNWFERIGSLSQKVILIVVWQEWNRDSAQDSFSELKGSILPSTFLYFQS